MAQTGVLGDGMTHDESTRLAVLETKLDNLTTSLNDLKQQIKKNNETISSMDKRLDGQKAFAFGVIGAASTIAGFVGWAIGQFKERIFG